MALDTFLVIDEWAQAKHFARLAEEHLDEGRIERALWELRAAAFAEALAPDPLPEFVIAALDHFCAVRNAQSGADTRYFYKRQQKIAKGACLDDQQCKGFGKADCTRRGQLSCRDELRYLLLAEESDHLLWKQINDGALLESCDRAFAQAAAEKLHQGDVFTQLFPKPAANSAAMGAGRVADIASQVMRSDFGEFGQLWDVPSAEQLASALETALRLAEEDGSPNMRERFICLIVKRHSAAHYMLEIKRQVQLLPGYCGRIVSDADQADRL